jgi:hypothetical protein
VVGNGRGLISVSPPLVARTDISHGKPEDRNVSGTGFEPGNR